MSKKFKKKDFIKYWRKKYFYFISFNLLFWYFFAPVYFLENNNLAIHILPLDILFGTHLGGFFEINLFELIFYNLLAAIGIYAISVTVFIFVTGADFWDDGEFEKAAFRWLTGLEDKNEKITWRITRKMFEKEKKEDSIRNFKQWMFNISIIYIPIVTKTVVNIAKYLIN